MIGYVFGKVIFNDNNKFLLLTGGVGYEITCSASAVNLLLQKQEGGVYTYTAVREDGIYLYGFSSIEEKNMFLKLISVSGVGPKTGIDILSGIDLQTLAVMIATSDVKGLSSIKGLGKKTAERIIVELREKVEEFNGGDVKSESCPENKDVLIALMSLGFTQKECAQALKVAKECGAKTIQETIALALKNIR